jgi:ABC-type branched-subunit amino acid transport system substrate-binding protein
MPSNGILQRIIKTPNHSLGPNRLTRFSQRRDHVKIIQLRHTRGYKAFLEKHQKKYGEKPLSVFHAHAYDAAMIIFAAIEKVAKKGPDGALYIGRQKLRDALYETKGFKGLTGTITCDKYGDCADPRIAIYQTTEENVRKLVMPDKPFWIPEPAPAEKVPTKKVPAKK